MRLSRACAEDGEGRLDRRADAGAGAVAGRGAGPASRGGRQAGLATDALLRELEAEEACKGVLSGRTGPARGPGARRHAGRPPGGARVGGLAAEVQALLGGAPGQARQMLRKLFAGHRIAGVPFADPDGTRGYDFEAEGTYAALLTGRRIVNDGGVPEGYSPPGTTFVVEGRAAQVVAGVPEGDWHLLLGVPGAVAI